MEVNLSPELEQFAQHQAREHGLASAPDYIAQLVSEQAQLDADNTSIALGIQQAENGEGQPLAEAMDDLRRDLHAKHPFGQQK